MSKLDKYINPLIKSMFFQQQKRRIKRQNGGQGGVIVENNEFVKDNQGEVYQVKNAPTHDDTELIVGNKVKKVPKYQGGQLLNDVESVISATHENRKQSDQSYTYKDEEIKIKPQEAVDIAKELGFKIKKPSKSISPSKLLELSLDRKSKLIPKFSKISNMQDKLGTQTSQANLDSLVGLPTDEDLYDSIFNHQESKKSSNDDGEYFQQGGLSTSVDEPLSINQFIKKPRKTDFRFLTKNGANQLLNKAQKMDAFNEDISQKYYDGEKLKLTDNKYNIRNNAKVSKEMLIDMARAAKVQGLTQEQTHDFLGIIGKESSYGENWTQKNNPRDMYKPSLLASNWEQQYMGISNNQQLAESYIEYLTNDEMKKVDDYVDLTTSYPFASEIDTFKKKTKKYGLRGYNYGDPKYGDRIQKEKEILNFPQNKKVLQTLDSAYQATPKKYFKQHGGSLAKYL